MIDEAWLEGLRFDAPSGIRVTGLVGIGDNRVVFNAVTQDGTGVVLKVPRCSLGFYIKELPLFITSKPEYDVNRLNQKLLRLVGNPLLDSITRPYDDLYTILIHILHEHNVPGLIISTFTPESVETIPFILHTPGMKRRLQELATLQEKGLDHTDLVVTIGYVPGHGFDALRPVLIERAKGNLLAIERVQQVNPYLQPDRLSDNPLYIWGAAIMDGFFTDEELPQAVGFLTEQFGSLSEHSQTATFIDQAHAIANLLAQFTPEHNISRFVKFCAMAGLVFQVIDRDGNEVADGLKLLMENHSS